MREPRPYTEEEVINLLMTQFHQIVRYWATVPLGAEHGCNSPEEEILYRCEGVAFTILSSGFDGASSLPGIDLVMCPQESDKEYFRSMGSNWIPQGMRISTQLHEHFSKART